MGHRDSMLLKKIVRLGILGALLAWCVCTTSAQRKTANPAKQSPRKTVTAKAAKKAAPKAPHATAAKKSSKPNTPKAAKAAPLASERTATATLRPVAETRRGRDPFAALVHAGDPGAHTNLPPGIAGLQVATVELQGTVKSSEGMVAVVANPQDRVYFLHDGDHIYDGIVAKISPGEITFQQESKDPFGRTVERAVTKRLYSMAGDEQ